MSYNEAKMIRIPILQTREQRSQLTCLEVVIRQQLPPRETCVVQ